MSWKEEQWLDRTLERLDALYQRFGKDGLRECSDADLLLWDKQLKLRDLFKGSLSEEQLAQKHRLELEVKDLSAYLASRKQGKAPDLERKPRLKRKPRGDHDDRPHAAALAGPPGRPASLPALLPLAATDPAPSDGEGAHAPGLGRPAPPSRRLEPALPTVDWPERLTPYLLRRGKAMRGLGVKKLLSFFRRLLSRGRRKPGAPRPSPEPAALPDPTPATPEQAADWSSRVKRQQGNEDWLHQRLRSLPAEQRPRHDPGRGKGPKP
jgi:hypothetical protein